MNSYWTEVITTIAIFIFVGWLFSHTGEWMVLWFLILLFFVKSGSNNE